jgi:hypothetical protein
VSVESFRHAAALALVGWYLMAPAAYPAKNGMWRWDAAAPLSRWKLVKSFDSAVQCEAELLERQRGAKMENKASVRNFVESFQCIASDDPRLREK